MSRIASIEAVRAEQQTEDHMVAFWMQTLEEDLESAGVEYGTARVILNGIRQYGEHVAAQTILRSALNDLLGIHPSSRV